MVSDPKHQKLFHKRCSSPNSKVALSNWTIWGKKKLIWEFPKSGDIQYKPQIVGLLSQGHSQEGHQSIEAAAIQATVNYQNYDFCRLPILSI